MVGPRTGQAGAANETRVRNRAYLTVAAGIVLIKSAYLELLLDRGDSLGLPLLVAVAGFAVATLGYLSFTGHEKRSRFRYSLGSPRPGSAHFESGSFDGGARAHPRRALVPRRWLSVAAWISSNTTKEGLYESRFVCRSSVFFGFAIDLVCRRFRAR